MKKIMKNIAKYTLVFAITAFILFLLLVLTAKIPREKVVENLKETLECFDIRYDFVETKAMIQGRDNTFRHIYMDAMILNIIYYIDTQNPIESAMEAMHYTTDNWKQITYDFEDIIENNYEANREYLRYWHGSMSIMRPLLVFFNINEMYTINVIVLSISAIILLILLAKTKIKELIISFIIASIMCVVWVVPFCFEYYWNFLIMIIVSIIAIILDKKGKNLNILLMISGMLTCYLDSLTTEVITFGVPIIIILTIRYKQDRLKSFKEGFKFLVVSTIFWSIGYVGMWLTKWILAAIILKTNVLEYIIDNIRFRITGEGYEEITSILSRTPNLPGKALMRNIKMLYPYDQLRRLDLENLLPICLIILELVFIRKKDFKKLWFSGLLLIIAIIPYIRYLALASHAFSHDIFTFRSQMISIIAIILAMIYSFDKDVMKKEVKIRGKK